jgi:mannose-6-phosphate isomerase-like protein (cupin superfamily)
MKNTVLFALASFGFARLAFAADAPPTDVVLLDHAKVDAAFAQGMPMLVNTSYKVQAGRRVVAGNAELHAKDTDIFYIVDGSATFVTGGTVEEPKDTGPGEIRGKSVTGGVPHHLTKGDIIVIPKGTPHQFTQVDGTFLYLVVKVTQ